MVLENMLQDEFGKLLFEDRLITTYGSFNLASCGLRKINTISERMRLLAKLVQKVRLLTGKDTASLEDFLKPEYFETIITASKSLGQFTMTTEEGEPVPAFAKPSIPLKIGYTLEKCACLLRGIGIKTRDLGIEEDAARFGKLFELEWSQQISTVAVRTMNTSKFNKVQLLPITEDLLKIRKFMIDSINIHLNSLLRSKDVSSWRRLAEVLGSRLTVFNRRRSNEVYQLLVSRFQDRDKWKGQELSEIKDSLSSLEKTLVDR